MISIDIDQEYQSKIESLLVEKAAINALRHQSALPGTELTIVVTTDEHLKKLNQKFLDIDAATDVLSFPANFIDPENETQYLGDIIISYPRAENQAKKGGHAVIEEVQLLVVHGILHLLGHDHAEVAEKNRMWSAQIEILKQLGLENLDIPEDYR